MARIGLLEDNFRIANLCATMLHFAGHEVVIYDHPRQCLQALLPEIVQGNGGAKDASASLPVEILILDLYLPDIPGIEVLRRLQSHPHTQSLPLILCTAAPDADVIRALRIVPHASIIEKPFKIETLTSAINSVLKSVV